MIKVNKEQFVGNNTATTEKNKQKTPTEKGQKNENEKMSKKGVIIIIRKHDAELKAYRK